MSSTLIESAPSTGRPADSQVADRGQPASAQWGGRGEEGRELPFIIEAFAQEQSLMFRPQYRMAVSDGTSRDGTGHDSPGMFGIITLENEFQFWIRTGRIFGLCTRIPMGFIRQRACSAERELRRYLEVLPQGGGHTVMRYFGLEPYP